MLNECLLREMQASECLSSTSECVLLSSCVLKEEERKNQESRWEESADFECSHQMHPVTHPLQHLEPNLVKPGHRSARGCWGASENTRFNVLSNIRPPVQWCPLMTVAPTKQPMGGGIPLVVALVDPCARLARFVQSACFFF